LAPQAVDEPVAGDDLVRVQKQQREEHSLLRAAQLEHPAIEPGLDGAEDEELHPLSKAPLQGDFHIPATARAHDPSPHAHPQEGGRRCPLANACWRSRSWPAWLPSHPPSPHAATPGLPSRSLRAAARRKQEERSTCSKTKRPPPLCPSASTRA